MGLVKSCPASHDRRIRELRLTAAGLKMERELSAVQRSKLESIFEELGPQNEQIWLETMKKVAEMDGTQVDEFLRSWAE
jgi:DNA-binding MarR family transcriptional regulator